jgi:hypothetical protein
MRKPRKPHRKPKPRKRASTAAASSPKVTASTRIDFGDQKLAQHFPDELLARAFNDVHPRLEALLKDVKAGFVTAPDQQIPDDSVFQYLDACRLAVEGELIKKANRFSPLQWLYYLRGVPFSYWAGDLPSTGPYDAQLAEIISGRSTRQGGFRRKGSDLVGYPVDAVIAKTVAEFCIWIKFLSQLHTNLRWAGKGAAFDFRSSGCGFALPSPELAKAVTLYDTRNAVDEGFVFFRTGLGSSEEFKNCATSIPVVPRAVPPVSTVLGSLNFGLEQCCLDELRDFNRSVHAAGCAWWTDEPALLVAFLHYVTGLVADSPHVLTRTGCLFMSREDIDAAPPQYMAEAKIAAQTVFPGAAVPDTLSELIASLAAIQGSAWPLLCAPVIRTEANLVCLDLSAATTLLQQTATLKPLGGDLGNRRGVAFERSVQAIVDTSPWAPAPALRALLVGTVIENAGQRVTDLDAVGIRGNDMLLISCKSSAYSGQYDTGDRSTIAGVESKVSQALTAWRDKTTFIRNNPHCLAGIDFSHYRIIPVVCYPFAPFLTLGPMTDEVELGLRSMVSISELRARLHRQ